MPSPNEPPPLMSWVYAAAFLLLFAVLIAVYALMGGDPLALLT